MSARYRVWWEPQVPCRAFRVECLDLATASALTEVLARYDLFQMEHRIKPDFCNAGGIEEWDAEADEWIDVDEEDVPEPPVTVLNPVAGWTP